MICPHCGNEMDVALQGKPSSMIVCVCGKCKAPLVSLDGDVFELDREEFQTLRKKLSHVVDALVANAEATQVNNSKMESKQVNAQISSPKVQPPAFPHTAISKADVDDLRIDLETCKDVSEFIDRL